MKPSRLARTVTLASFLGTASLVGGAVFEDFGPEEAEAGYQVDNSYFYTSLAVHGSWVQNAEWGWVWYPTRRASGWRPYTVGHWAWTDYGEWMWISDEPYGWATYHYGRWYLDPFYGWAWIPGSVWAPAWVSWRDCDDYIGWAPLGPWGYWDSGYYRGWDRWDRWDRHDHHGYNDHDGHHGGGGDHDWDNDRDGHDGGDGDHDGDRGGRGRSYAGNRHGEDHDSWNFTRKRDFDSPRVEKVVLDRSKLPTVYNRSRALPPPSKEDERQGRGTTRAFDKSSIERHSGRTIRPVKVEEDKSPPARGGSRESAGRGAPGLDRVRVFRPNVNVKPDAPTPDKLGVAKAPARDGRGDDNRSQRGQSTTRKPELDTGGFERPARADERGGYERPVSNGERSGGGRPGQFEDRKGGREPLHQPRGEGGQGGQVGQDHVEQPRNAGGRAPQVERFERTPQRGSSSSQPGRYEAPTADQRRAQPRTPAVSPSRGPQSGAMQPRGNSGATQPAMQPRSPGGGSSHGVSPGGGGRSGGSPADQGGGGGNGSSRQGSPSQGSHGGSSRGGSPGGSSGGHSGGGSPGGTSGGGASHAGSSGASAGSGYSGGSSGGHAGGGGGGGGRSMGR